MKKNITTFLLLLLFTGCLDPLFKKNEMITKYTLDKYEQMLQKNNISEMKCVPTNDGNYSVVFYTTKIANDFPATIQIDKAQTSYNVYFDNGYLNLDKAKLITDIDGCMVELEKQILIKKTWSN